jgi:UDP-glucose 4-epimerase
MSDVLDAPILPRGGARRHPNLVGVRCAVLGAGGFLGGALVAALCAEGAIVHGFGRRGVRSRIDERSAWTEASFADTDALARVLEGQQLVFHFISSSLPATSNRVPAAALADDVYPTLDLLERCVSAGVEKVVFASSGGTVYGVPGTIPTPEIANTTPISAYGIAKLTIEKYLALYRHLHGLDFVALRIANPYGPGQSPHKKLGVIASMVHAALTGSPIEIWGSGEVIRDFVYVADVIDAILCGAEYAGGDRIFNIGSGVGRSVNDVLADVRRAFGDVVLDVVRKPGRTADVPVSVLDTTLARRELGWSPTVDFCAGIDQTVRWMRGQRFSGPGDARS